jgi:D-glycero-D-manno-heptose 1,7-bisphosphate phosphatase
MAKIVILDRDGVINLDSTEYIKSPAEWHPIEGSLEAITLLHEAGFRIFIATNQSGLARQYFTVSTLDAIHQKMIDAVEAQGGHISGIFYCPHHPDDRCNCRKPAPGLLDQISELTEETLQGVPFVGDSLSDLKAASNYGCEPILVDTGNGQLTRSKLTRPYPKIFANLLAAAQFIIRGGL